MKTCTTCRKTKTLNEFHRARLGAQGRAAKCRHCRASQAHDRFIAKRPEITAKAKTWRHANEERVRATAREKHARRGIERREYFARYRAKNRLKRQASKAVHNALLSGRLRKPDTCATCGRKSVRLLAHHDSYEESRWLDVRFICYRCHGEHHAQEKAA